MADRLIVYTTDKAQSSWHLRNSGNGGWWIISVFSTVRNLSGGSLNGPRLSTTIDVSDAAMQEIRDNKWAVSRSDPGVLVATNVADHFITEEAP